MHDKLEGRGHQHERLGGSSPDRFAPSSIPQPEASKWTPRCLSHGAILWCPSPSRKEASLASSLRSSSTLAASTSLTRVCRLLSHHIQSLYFSPSQLAPLLRSLRGVLFPNNAPGTPTLFPPPSDDELRALRTRAANALWGLLPGGVGRLYFGGGSVPLRRPADGLDDQEDMMRELEGLLMVFSDEYCNKHLMYSVLELVLVRLMPELSRKGVEELWEDRLG